MKRFLTLLPLIVLLLAALAACGGQGIATHTAPGAVSAADDALATLRVATSVADATRRAEAKGTEDASLATAQARNAAEWEMALISTQSAGTREALSAIATQAAGTQAAMAAQQTREAAMAAPAATQTQSAKEAPAIAATQTQIAAAASVEGSKATREQVLVWVVPACLLVVAFFIGWSIKARTDWKIEKERMASSIRETRDGSARYLYDPNMDQWIWELFKAAAAVRRYGQHVSDFDDAEPADPVEVSPRGITSTGPLRLSEPNGTHAKAERLLRESLTRLGDDAVQILTLEEAEKIGVSPWHWRTITDALEELGLIDKRNNGTFVRDGNVGDVLYKLETRQVHLRPRSKTPSPPPPWWAKTA